MLQRAQKNLASSAVYQTRCFATTVPHSRIPQEKDYYKILGVEKSATPEMVKDAYRELAKRHHPDVVGGTAPDADKFRDVMEAYGVLSVRESRANYDISMRKNPDAYREVSESQHAKELFFDKRDVAGNTPINTPVTTTAMAKQLARAMTCNANTGQRAIDGHAGGGGNVHTMTHALVRSWTRARHTHGETTAHVQHTVRGAAMVMQCACTPGAHG